MSASSSAIESVLVENRVFPPPAAFAQAARISGMPAYEALCVEAEADYEGFWARLARENLEWSRPFSQTLDSSNAPFYQWFADGELNASANCLDRHMGTAVEHKTAIIFEADDGAVTRVSYRELLERVSQFANALKAQGVQKGDRVLIYMPMTIEGVVAMQACARIGATHSVVFGGFSAKAVQERIIDAGAVVVITANYQLRGGKELPLKAIVYVVRSGDDVRCAKVYKEANQRSFHQAVAYQEGRRVKNSRQARAMEKGTKYGRKMAEETWQNAEVDALYRLAAAGVRVPTPYICFEGVLLMELVVDADGNAAPRLNDVPLTEALALKYHAALLRLQTRIGVVNTCGNSSGGLGYPPLTQK